MLTFENIDKLKDHIWRLYGAENIDMTLTGVYLTNFANEVPDQFDASIDCNSLSSASKESSLLSSPRPAPIQGCYSGHIGKCSSNCSCDSCCSCNISTTSSERTFEQNLALGIRHLSLLRRTYSSVVAGATVSAGHSYFSPPPTAARLEWTMSTPASSPQGNSSPPMSPWPMAWPPLPPPYGSLTPPFFLVTDSPPVESPCSSIVFALSGTTSTDRSISIVSASDIQGNFDLSPAYISTDAGNNETLDLSFLDEANLTCSDIEQKWNLAPSRENPLVMDCSFVCNKV